MKDRIASKKPSLSVKELKALLDYCPETGVITWKPRPLKLFSNKNIQRYWNRKYSGERAFNSYNGHGYLYGEILGKRYRAHRLAFALYYGKWPGPIVDHIDGVRDNNRIENLRSVTDLESCRNRGRAKNNTSGILGVGWNKHHKKWRVQLMANGKQMFFGYFDCLLAAAMVRKKAEQEYGFHINHGRS